MPEHAPQSEHLLPPLLKAGLSREIIAAALRCADNTDTLNEESRLYRFAVKELAKLGEIKQAEKVLEEITEPDYALLAEIGIAEVEGSDSERWEDVRNSVLQLDEGNQGYVLEEYAWARGVQQLTDGDIAAAIETARDTGDHELYLEILSTLVIDHDDDWAYEVAREMETPHEGFGAIAKYQAEDGRVDDALNTLHTFRAGNAPAYAVEAIVLAQMQQNNIRGARRTVSRFGARPAVEEMVGTPKAKVRRGLLKLFGVEAPAPQPTRQDLETHVKALLNAGNTAGALSLTEVLEDTQSYYLVVVPVAVHMFLHGQREEARQLLSDRSSSNHSYTRGLLALAEVAGFDSSLWLDALDAANDDEEPSTLYDFIYSSIRRTKTAEPPSQLPELPLATLSPRQVGLLGSYAYKQWDTFVEHDSLTYARLAHGAAEVAVGFMSDDERRQFIRALTEQFVTLRHGGTFDNGRQQIVLMHLSEALADLDNDGGATSELLQAMRANLGNFTGLRLMKSLIECNNATAAAAAIGLLCDPATPDHIYNYLLHKLADQSYIDTELPNAIKKFADEGWPEWASLHRQIF